MSSRAALVILMLAAATPLAWAQSEDHAPVYIEDSPAAQELVEQARVMQDQGRLTEAVTLLQRVIDEYGSKLMLVRPGLYEESSLWVRRRLLTDPMLLEAYRQVHTGDAERLLAEGTARGVDEAGLERVVSRYYLTAPALEAGLTLAGSALERADIAASRSVLAGLSGHPDLARSGEWYHELSASAACFAGDEEAFVEHRRALEERGAGERVEALDRLKRQIHAPNRIADRSGPANGSIAPALETLDRPLWTVTLRPPQEQANPMPYGGPRTETYPIVPSGDADQLYINEGERLRAVDRFSGRELWSYEPASPAQPEMTPLAMRMARSFVDRRGALSAGGFVFAAVGEPAAWPSRGDDAGAGTYLACLNRATGEKVWQVEPQQIEPGFLKAYFQGTPLVAGDRVFALLRRNQTSGFQDAFLVALDAGTGAPLWRRHISSAVTASRYASTSPAQMTMHEGTIYVCDNLATVAAVVGRTGSLLWARVLLDDAQANPRGLMAAGGESPVDVLPPVLTATGLVVPPLGPNSEVTVLDPQTGEDVRTLEVAGNVDYLLPAGDDVVTVGRSVALFRGDTLELLWSADLEPARADAVRTQGVVTREHVVIPSGDRLVVLDRKTGNLIVDASGADVGNVLALEDQLVVADSNTVRSYLPWATAYAALVSQAAAAPADASPGLAIAHLAIALGREPQVIEGVDRAVRAIDESVAAPQSPQTAAMQARAFDQVLTFATSSRAGADLRRQLFERLASLSADPRQEVAYHLAAGTFLEEQGQWAEAVEHFQAVLLDDTLAVQMHEDDDVVRQASLEAQRRLARLVEAQGQAVYERYDLMAAQQLRELVSRPPADPDALIALARRFPMASAAPEALFQAAVSLASTGRSREAAAQLRLAYRRATEPGVAARIVGRLAELYEQEARPRQALHWLRRVARERADLQPIRAGVATPLTAWISDLRSQQVLDRVGPALRLPLGEPRILMGQLVLPAAGPLEMPRDVALLRDGGKLRLHTGSTLAAWWERPVTPATEVLAVSDEQVLLWEPTTSVLSALDASTGDPAWPPTRLSEPLASLGDPAAREGAQPPEMRRFRDLIDADNGPIVIRNGQVVIERPEAEAGYVVAVSDAVVCVGDRRGALVGIDRHTGRVLWQKVIGVDRVDGARAEGELLAVWGANSVGSDAAGGAVQLLDLLTGEAKLPLIEDKEAAQWAGFAGEDHIAVASAAGVTAYRTSDGGVVWRSNTRELPPLTGQGWASSDLIILGVNEDGLLCLDAATGETLQRFHRFVFAGPGAAPPQLVEDQWHLMSSAHAVALGPDAKLQWRDALSTSGDHLVQQLVGERYVVLVSLAVDGVSVPVGMVGLQDRPERPADGVPRPAYQLVVLDRGTGAMVAEYGLDLPAGAIETLRGQFLDNHLLLSLGDRTLVVPGAE